MSNFSVPNPPYPRKKTKTGITFYTPQDEPNMDPGDHVLVYDTAGLCLSVPEADTYEMEDDSFVTIIIEEGMAIIAE